MKYLGIVALALALGGCTSFYSVLPTYRLEQSIEQYRLARGNVRLGDTLEAVRENFRQADALLDDPRWRKAAEHYVKEGVAVDICYLRSDFTFDGETTDDEFTPYLFNDGRLVAIGWGAIGGPKTRGVRLLSQGDAPAEAVRESLIVY